MTWRPLPQENKDRNAIPVSESLRRLADKLGTAPPATLGAIFEHWPAAAGEQVAAHSEPVSLVNKVLVVSVDDSRWANELKWLSSKLVERLGERVGVGIVDRIDIQLKGRISPK